MVCFLKNQRGQSLIELSVAVGLTSMALVAILSLIMVSVVTQRKSSNYYTAVNLAREAIEAARNIRDTNWLLIEQQENAGSVTTNWDDNLQQTPVYSTVLRFDPNNIFSATQSRYSFEFIGIGESLETRKIIYKRDLGSGTVYLDYITAQNCFDCQETIFKRWIYLKPICDGSKIETLPNCTKESITGNFICDNDGSCIDIPPGDPSAPKIGIRVIVEITWQEGNKSNNIKLVEDLYNWR